MNNIKNYKKRYKIVSKVNDEEESQRIGRIIAYFGLLAIICVLSFLIAKYIVRSRIDGEGIPIDTSERL